MVSVLASALLLGSCTFPGGKLRGDRAFITYTAPPVGSGALRLAVKDLIDVKGEVTTAGSEFFAKRGLRAAEDAECLKGARARGVVIVGKTNLTELALGPSGLNDYYGTPRNRVDGRRRLMPGGSSSGSAVAVATGRADVAFGTDTAGSVRMPAACCGIYGLKTTFGLVSLKGVHPISPKRLDTVGPMAKDLPNLVEGMDMLKPGTRGEYMDAMAAHPRGAGIRVGRLYVDGTDPAIDQAVDDALRAAGFQVVRLSEDFAAAWEQARKNGQRIAVGDGYVSDKYLLGERGVTGTTKAAILLGEFEYDSEAYRDAVRQQAGWQRLLRRTFQRVDLIATPTLKGHPLGIPWFGRLPVFEARALALQNTVSVNYAGNPAIVLPVPLKDGPVPVTSLQLIGPMKSEASLLNAARIVGSTGA